MLISLKFVRRLRILWIFLTTTYIYSYVCFIYPSSTVKYMSISGIRTGKSWYVVIVVDGVYEDSSELTADDMNSSSIRWCTAKWFCEKIQWFFYCGRAVKYKSRLIALPSQSLSSFCWVTKQIFLHWIDLNSNSKWVSSFATLLFIDTRTYIKWAHNKTT